MLRFMGKVVVLVVGEVVLCFFFFFQAEDGIRDDLVTGVQTCALPILKLMTVHGAKGLEFPHVFLLRVNNRKFPANEIGRASCRERSVELGGRRIIKKKKRKKNSKSKQESR